MPTTSGMKGGGFYDQHSSGQRSSIEILLPWVDEAAATVTLPDRAAPVTLVDYGCSEGRNAILVADRAVEALRRRGAENAVRAVFADLASNDFNQLFRNLRDEGRLAAQCPGFFPMVVGGSFYAPLMPAGSVHLATTFNAVCWLDRVPAEPLPDFIIYPGPHSHRPDVHVSRAVVESFSRQAADDLVRFLVCRADEMAPGGQLLIAVPARNEQYWTGAGVYDLLHDACVDLVREGRIDGPAYQRALMPVYFRSLDELVAPIQSSAAPLHDVFAIEKASCDEVPTSFVVDHQRTGAVDRYVDEFVGFFQAFSEPVLRAALEPTSGAEAVSEIYRRAKQRLRAAPDAYPFHYLQAAVLLRRR